MQIDMHYYGTWAMARAAGLSRESATAIATAAQFVDDNVEDEPLVLKDGARLLRRPTAHHLNEIRKNVEPDDQREVWVPFHFLPGLETGHNGDGDYTELLRCRKDSEPARHMVEVMIERAGGDPQILERAGITAHVYADTFSHYGFSGVSSRRNFVLAESIAFDHNQVLAAQLKEWGAAFFDKYGEQGGTFENIKSWVARTRLGRRAAEIQSTIGEIGAGGLGHGAVAIYPDLPYLDWSYTYQFPKPWTPPKRHNLLDFIDACEALHGMFARLGQVRSDLGGRDGRPFADIRRVVTRVLGTIGDKDDRIGAWQEAVGELFPGETIPRYDGEAWTNWMEAAQERIDSSEALAHPACRFHLAANAHRSWVLHELLPSRNLLVA